MLFATARMLRSVNLWMAGATAKLEGKNGSKPHAPGSASSQAASGGEGKAQMKTALQVINEMIKARLTQPKVDFLNDTGKRLKNQDPISSLEYERLKERGLIVLNVSIGNLRFSPVGETEVIKQWEANWLANALAEKDQIDRRRSLIETAGQEQALRQYAHLLSQALERDKPSGVKATLKTLLMRSRSIIIRDDQLRRKMSAEQQELDAIIRWIEVNGP
jgi:hypothetical protein